MNYLLLTVFVTSTFLAAVVIRYNVGLIALMPGLQRRMLLEDRARKDGGVLFWSMVVAAGSGLALVLGAPG